MFKFNFLKFKKKKKIIPEFQVSIWENKVKVSQVTLGRPYKIKVLKKN